MWLLAVILAESETAAPGLHRKQTKAKIKDQVIFMGEALHLYISNNK